VSDYTPTKNEVLWSNISAGTTLATFTTEASLMGGIIVPVIPGGYFLNNNSTGRTLKLKAWGRIGSTTTGPTMIWSVRLINHGTAFSAGGGILLGATAALTMAASQTLAPWELELDITMDNPNQGATSVVTSLGKVWSPKGLASPFGGTIPDNNVTTNTLSTFDDWQTYDLYISLTCGTSNAANLGRLDRGKLYGEN
jgi:hypothetical protein